MPAEIAHTPEEVQSMNESRKESDERLVKDWSNVDKEDTRKVIADMGDKQRARHEMLVEKDPAYTQLHQMRSALETARGAVPKVWNGEKDAIIALTDALSELRTAGVTMPKLLDQGKLLQRALTEGNTAEAELFAGNLANYLDGAKDLIAMQMQQESSKGL